MNGILKIKRTNIKVKSAICLDCQPSLFRYNSYINLHSIYQKQIDIGKLTENIIWSENYYKLNDLVFCYT